MEKQMEEAERKQREQEERAKFSAKDAFGRRTVSSVVPGAAKPGSRGMKRSRIGL
jgi:hypothetical protein